MPSLLDTVTSLLRQGDNLEKLGAMLGTDARRASVLVDLATPVVITGLADRAFEPGGSDIVVRLLDGVDPKIVEDPLVFVERGDATIGEGLLLSIFAEEHATVTTMLADKGKVSEPVISRLLPGILALAIGVLGRRRAVREVDEAGVLTLLAAEKSVLPADGFADTDGFDDGADENRIPAMAGAAPVTADAAVSSAPVPAGRTTPGSAGSDSGTESGPAPSSTTEVETVGDPADDGPGGSQPLDRSTNGREPASGSTDLDGRAPLLLIVGGLTAVVLLAWALSRLGGGGAETTEARSGATDFVEQPVDDASDEAVVDPAERTPATAVQSEEPNGEVDGDTDTRTDTGTGTGTDTESEQPADDGAGETGGDASEPVTINEELSLDPITFEVGSATITTEGLAVLDVAAEYLRADPELSIEIAGHTDSVGDAADNMRLSQDRAGEVEAYLESLGIDGARMTPIGYGENDPIATNDTEAGKAQNRRIEFVIR